jgi:hypothetical protein
MSGTLKVGNDGSAELKEDDGIDYAATTVQLPGGERVAFLFTIKQFDGKGTLDNIKGDFLVPSYRGSSFLDPKVCAAARSTQIAAFVKGFGAHCLALRDVHRRARGRRGKHQTCIPLCCAHRAVVARPATTTPWPCPRALTLRSS